MANGVFHINSDVIIQPVTNVSLRTSTTAVINKVAAIGSVILKLESIQNTGWYDLAYFSPLPLGEFNGVYVDGQTGEITGIVSIDMNGKCSVHVPKVLTTFIYAEFCFAYRIRS